MHISALDVHSYMCKKKKTKTNPGKTSHGYQPRQTIAGMRDGRIAIQHRNLLPQGSEKQSRICLIGQLPQGRKTILATHAPFAHLPQGRKPTFT